MRSLVSIVEKSAVVRASLYRFVIHPEALKAGPYSLDSF
jgi:hypothetical protein